MTNASKLYDAILTLPDDQFAAWLSDLDRRIEEVQSGRKMPIAAPKYDIHNRAMVAAMKEEREAISYTRAQVGQLKPQIAKYENGYVTRVEPKEETEPEPEEKDPFDD